ncbi:TPA: GGDEF domain-containing protein [Klebsiella oxytoca]|nr:GGDEF domain-containing protein [Klebsiella oxytoca]
MKNKIQKKAYFKKFPLLIILIIFNISVAISLNIYRAYLDVEYISTGFTGDLQRIFNENERIALSISSRYYELVSKNSCPENILNTQLMGMVSNQSNIIHSGSIDASCLTAALEFINKKASSSFKKTSAARYFYAPSINYLYFFTDDIDKNINISHLNRVILDEGDKITPPDYYERILSDNIKRKGLSATDIYIDKITHEKTYTIVSHVYSLNKFQLIGNLFYDHTASELKNILEKHFSHSESKWLSAKLVEFGSGESLYFFGSSSHSHISYVVEYSDKYRSVVSVNIPALLKSDKITLITVAVLILLCFVIFVSSAKAESRNYIKNMVDPLTKLYTRKALKYIQPDIGSYFILCDVNKFKQINDTWGHAVGDIALQKIASTIQNNIKSTDAAIRLGGDEFLIYIKNTKQNEAYETVNRIKTTLSKSPLYQEGESVLLSVSFGIAEHRGQLKDTLKNADKNMYLNKNSSDI